MSFQKDDVDLWLASVKGKKNTECISMNDIATPLSRGDMVGLVVRALAFHRCGPGSSLSSGAQIICELSLFDVLFFTMSGFFLWVLQFFLPQQKINM